MGIGGDLFAVTDHGVYIAVVWVLMFLKDGNLLEVVQLGDTLQDVLGTFELDNRGGDEELG